MTDIACTLPQCYFAMIDVDLEISIEFFDHMIAYLKSREDHIIYYPILFSEYDPTSVRAAEAIFGALGPHDPHRGMWRQTGYGIYAILGAAVKDLKITKRLNSRWGGEDVELHKLVQERGFDIVREREPGLVHKWHDKICTSEFVEYDYLDRCLFQSIWCLDHLSLEI